MAQENQQQQENKQKHGSLIPPSIANNLPSMARNELARLGAQKQDWFVEEFRRRAKSTGIAYIYFFIVFGAHYAYLRNWGMQIMYWLTLGGVSIWFFIDLFRIPGLIRRYNRDVGMDVLRDLKAVC